MQRRTFVRGTLGSGILGLAVLSGLVTPTRVLAAWPRALFENRDAAAVIEQITGGKTTGSELITIDAEAVAAESSLYPIRIISKLKNTEQIFIVSETNPLPLLASFRFPTDDEANIKTRIKLADTGNVVVIVKANDRYYITKKAVEVTAGGCGG